MLMGKGVKHGYFGTFGGLSASRWGRIFRSWEQEAEVKAPKLVRVPFLIPPRMAGMTLGRFILIPRHITPTVTLIAHELVHVDQFQTFGVARFLAKYLWSWARNGFRYSRIDFEREAYELESQLYYRAWAERVLVASGWQFDGR